MKKQRTNSASKAAKRARKAARQKTAAARVIVLPGLAVGVPAKTPVALPKSKKIPQLKSRDYRLTTFATAGGVSKLRQKGPPIRAENAVAGHTIRESSTRRASASKLSPALVARLAASLSGSLVEVASRRPRPTPWARDEWRTTIILLLPALITLTLLLSVPRLNAPLSQTSLAVTLRAPQTAAAMVAAVASAATAAAADTDAKPRYSRPSEPIASADPHIVEHFAIVTASLARDMARAIPTPVPPSELPALSLPGAVPELAAAAAVAALGEKLFEPPAIAPAFAGATPPMHLCSASSGIFEAHGTRRPLSPLTPDLALAEDPLRFGQALADAAKAQTRELVIYNANYMTIAYPRGDVPSLFGVCTDVVIRAYRALDIDLQELVHDTRAGPSDTNIDHRRTELLRRFFAMQGEQLPVTSFIEDYLPGDIVTYYRPQNRSSTAHIAVVTSDIAPSGRPLIAHNRGWGVQLEDALFVDQMTGHYRFRGPSPALLAVVTAGRNSASAVVKLAVQARSDSQVSSISPGSTASAVAKPPRAVLTRLTGLTATKLLRPPMGLGANPKPTVPQNP